MKSASAAWNLQPRGMLICAVRGALALVALVFTALVFVCAYWLEGRTYAA